MDLERHDPGPAPGIRTSDAERDRVVGLLKQHFTDGRLTMEEFSDRMDTAYAARTRGELVTTLQDLPVLARQAPPPERRGRFDGREHHWALPVPLVPIALIALLVGMTILSRGMILWPFFFMLWIWGGRRARHRHYYPQQWERYGRGRQRYRMF